jgi:hypothetical protein
MRSSTAQCLACKQPETSWFGLLTQTYIRGWGGEGGRPHSRVRAHKQHLQPLVTTNPQHMADFASMSYSTIHSV